MTFDFGTEQSRAGGLVTLCLILQLWRGWPEGRKGAPRGQAQGPQCHITPRVQRVHPSPRAGACLVLGFAN